MTKTQTDTQPVTYLEQYQPALVVEILDLAGQLWPEGERFYTHAGLTTSTELQYHDHLDHPA